MKQATAYLSLGTNLGDRLQHLHHAMLKILKSGNSILKISPVYETPPWGVTQQPSFLNLCIALQTTLSPHALLKAMLQIELEMGRERTIKWGPRIIDIDIILYEDCVINTGTLIIPHPFFHERNFVLQPLADIHPDLLHPVLHHTLSTLLQKMVSESTLKLFSSQFILEQQNISIITPLP
ncbi:MAG: hypothetical protein RIQ89_1161 [Bacteroidota bacterium]|jgi:2-amino-4-hydroxy-6-hydroxymethyldihydropteridine diphosphokinase